MMNSDSGSNSPPPRRPRPFRKAVFAGLAVVMPPLLTIVLFLWAWTTIESYVLAPIESVARWAIRVSIAEISATPPVGHLFVEPDDPDRLPRITGTNMRTWVRIRTNWLPEPVHRAVEENPGLIPPATAVAYYDRYVQITYLRREIVLPIFVLAFVATLYLIGKFMARGVGRLLWNWLERLVNRLPLVSNVYSSVKQVTDFAFQEKETDLQFTRIVAVQYPRKGIWALGFLTGDGIPDVALATGEPVVSVLIPTSPMPATGFTITIPRSEVLELNVTMDQALQFCVSCGVVSPPATTAKSNTPPNSNFPSRPFESTLPLEAIAQHIDHQPPQEDQRVD